MEDKLQVLFAAVQRLAKQSGDSELTEYLAHPSHNSEAFQIGVDKHHERLGDVESFVAQHDRDTHPDGVASKTYTKDELDVIVRDSVKKAIAAARKGE